MTAGDSPKNDWMEESDVPVQEGCYKLKRDQKRIKKVRCISGYGGHQGISWRMRKSTFRCLKSYLHSFFLVHAALDVFPLQSPESLEASFRVLETHDFSF